MFLEFYMTRTILLIASLLSLSFATGCHAVNPVYSYEMGGFPAYGTVKKAVSMSDTKTDKEKNTQS